MNIGSQKMETYQIFVIPVGNEKITEGIEFHPREPLLKYKSREDLDHKE